MKPSILGFRPDVCRLYSVSNPHQELAQALTCIEHELFVNLPEAELIGSGWKKKNKSKLTPHVVAMISWFNRVRPSNLER